MTKKTLCDNFSEIAGTMCKKCVKVSNPPKDKDGAIELDSDDDDFYCLRCGNLEAVSFLNIICSNCVIFEI